MTISTKKRAGQPNAGTGSRATKKDQLIKLLGAKAGVDIKSLSERFGWQQHTTRAAITGLRKAGYEVTADKPTKGGLSKYRILSGPTVQEVGATMSAADGA